MLGRRIVSLIMAAIIATSMLISTGCSNDGEEKFTDYPVKIGNVKFVGRPSKVVCLSSTLIGIIYAMGFEDQLAGRTANCDYTEAESIQSFGTAEKPAVNLIQGNNIDVVVTDDTIPQDSIDDIQEIGVPVVVIPRATGRASLADMYSTLGTVFRGGNTGYNAGRKVANEVFKQLDDIERMVEKEETWNTCIIISSDIKTFATGDTMISAVLESVGGFNVAKDSTQGEYTLPDMMRSDPEVIICPAGVENQLRAKSNLVGIPALDNFRVYAMDMSVFDDQYQGIIKGAWRMAKILHPEVITDDIIPDGMLDKDYEEDVFVD